MQLLQSNGKQIGYTTGRGGLEKGRKTLVFVHGSGGNHLLWNHQRRYFQGYYNVVSVDLPGHGEAGGTGEESIEAYAHHLLHLLRSLPGEVFCLFGHSLGGAIVQMSALLSAQHVEALVLVGTGARLRVLPAVLTNIRERFQEAARLMSDYAFSKKTSEDIVQSGMEAILMARPEILLGDLTACDRFDIMDRVGEIQAPTLIICGRDDMLTPPKYAEYLANMIKDARLEIIEGAGHMVMIEQPEQLNRSVMGFLETLGETKVDARQQNPQ